LSTEKEKYIVGTKISPEEIVSEADNSGCKSIAYTYTEPTVFLSLPMTQQR